MKRTLIIIAIVLVGLLVAGGLVARPFLSQFNPLQVQQSGITLPDLPEGFSSEVFASGLDRPRFIAFGPDGTLFVAERGANRIVTIDDVDGDGVGDNQVVFADDLNRPHSIVSHDGAWYVGVPTGVIRLEDSDGDGTADRRETIVDDLPASGAHTTRTVEFLPDGRMVVSVGSSCNVCEEDDPRRAAILIYDSARGENGRLFAEGLRNAVGLAVQPGTGELWASNNGRDLMGDDVPPETIYLIEDGLDYGWPRCHSGTISDPEYGGESGCDGVEQPQVSMQAHTAPLGMTFYDGDAFPEAYQDDLFVALHGSWNRSTPVGYSVMRIPMDGNRPDGPAEPFATGWLDLETETASARPVDVVTGPDGALYVSDDGAGFIYRISYDGP